MNKIWLNNYTIMKINNKILIKNYTNNLKIMNKQYILICNLYKKIHNKVFNRKIYNLISQIKWTINILKYFKA